MPAGSCSVTDQFIGHRVQFYTNDVTLTANVSHYLAEGLVRGEWAVVIATADHRAAFERELHEQGVDVSGVVEDRRLVFCHAGETLAGFMIEGQPDWTRFDATVGELIRDLRTRSDGAGLRAYGEMVDLLWNSGHSSAAARLEHFWNELLKGNGFSLLCAYQIDIFGKEFQTGIIDPVLRAHTHLVPGGGNGNLNAALTIALREVLGPRAEGLQSLISANFRPSWAAIPQAESTVLWLRNNLPEYADEILCRAKGYCGTTLEGRHEHASQLSAAYRPADRR